MFFRTCWWDTCPFTVWFTSTLHTKGAASAFAYVQLILNYFAVRLKNFKSLSVGRSRFHHKFLIFHVVTSAILDFPYVYVFTNREFSRSSLNLKEWNEIQQIAIHHIISKKYFFKLNTEYRFSERSKFLQYTYT